MSRSDDSLTLSIKGTTDSVTIFDYFRFENDIGFPFQVENITFADGHIRHDDDVNSMARM